MRFLVKGFHFAGISAGLKEQAKKDLSLIFSLVPAAVAGVFTRNRVQAAPVVLDRQLVRRGTAQAIVTNSGHANACTGRRGMIDAVRMAGETALALGIDCASVLVSSTGRIGVPLPMHKITAAIPRLVRHLRPDGIEDAARGIMTTDKRPKWVHDSVRLGGERVNLAAIAKGAGMIHPNMATMLAYFVTDLNIGRPTLDRIFKEVVDLTFNQTTVDGDMSTNDTALILANGLVGRGEIAPASAAGRRFRQMLFSVADELARQIVRDGEGATKCVDIFVRGAPSDGEARKVADAVGRSLLVKTALFGEDPNWGRIVVAAGYSGVRFNPETVEVAIGPVRVVRQGAPEGGDSRTRARQVMRRARFPICINLHQGRGTAHLYTSDLTYEYVRINADYTT